MHPSVHLELARIRQKELITKAERARAARALVDRRRIETSTSLRRRGSSAPRPIRRRLDGGYEHARLDESACDREHADAVVPAEILHRESRVR